MNNSTSINMKRSTCGKKDANFAFVIFFALYLVMPSYCAIELSAILPLITASRIILLLFVLTLIARRRFIVSLHLCTDKKQEQSICIYIFGMIIINLFFVIQTIDAIKAILSLLLENLLFVWAVTRAINSRKRFIKALRILVYSSGVVAVVSIIGSLIGYNLFYYLHTVDREMIMASYIRLGFLRAEAGFGHAVYYGVYCTVMILMAMYLYEYDGKRKILGLLCIALNLIALIFCNSRGSLCACALALIFALIRKNKEHIKKYLRWFLLAAVAVIFVCTAIASMREWIIGIIQSMIGILGLTGNIENYGQNIEGIHSRFTQLTALIYVAIKSPFIGFGPRSNVRGVAMSWWNVPNSWWPLDTFDSGIVAVTSNFGYIGLFLQLSFFLQLLKITFSKYKNDPVMRMFQNVLVGYLLCLLSVSGVDNVQWMFIAMLVSYINIRSREVGTYKENNCSI